MTTAENMAAQVVLLVDDYAPDTINMSEKDHERFEIAILKLMREFTGETRGRKPRKKVREEVQ